MTINQPYIKTTLDDLVKLEHVVFGQNIVPKRTVHSILAGTHGSKLRGRGLDFEEVRLYVPGDDIRNIDWRVTARVRKTHTKVFNEERERPAFTLLDQSSVMFFGSDKYVKSVIAAQAAALSGFRILKKGDRFGGIVFNDQEYEVVKPKRNRSNVLQYLKVAAGYNQQLVSRDKINSNEDRLHEMIYRTNQYVTHDYVVTIISDFRFARKETFDLLKSISVHNDVILVHVSDPLDASFPGIPGLLTDGEMQIRMQGLSGSEKQEVEKQRDNLSQSFRELHQHYRIPVLDLSTSREVSVQLKDLFVKHAS